MPLSSMCCPFVKVGTSDRDLLDRELSISWLQPDNANNASKTTDKIRIIFDSVECKEHNVRVIRAAIKIGLPEDGAR